MMGVKQISKLLNVIAYANLTLGIPRFLCRVNCSVEVEVSFTLLPIPGVLLSALLGHKETV